MVPLAAVMNRGRGVHGDGACAPVWLSVCCVKSSLSLCCARRTDVDSSFLQDLFL